MPKTKAKSKATKPEGDSLTEAGTLDTLSERPRTPVYGSPPLPLLKNLFAAEAEEGSRILRDCAGTQAAENVRKYGYTDRKRRFGIERQISPYENLGDAALWNRLRHLPEENPTLWGIFRNFLSRPTLVTTVDLSALDLDAQDWNTQDWPEACNEVVGNPTGIYWLRSEIPDWFLEIEVGAQISDGDTIVACQRFRNCLWRIREELA